MNLSAREQSLKKNTIHISINLFLVWRSLCILQCGMLIFNDLNLNEFLYTIDILRCSKTSTATQIGM